MYGTTRNEAFHQQLKSYFRNVMLQTRRHAKVVFKVATLGKVLAGTLTKIDLIHTSDKEHELLCAGAEFFKQGCMKFRPQLRLLTKVNEQVDESLLPSNAKKIRKRKRVAPP